jgi:hypothetical protein
MKNKKETLAQYLARGGVITVCKPKKAPRVPESDKIHNRANGRRIRGTKTISERTMVMQGSRGSV